MNCARCGSQGNLVNYAEVVKQNAELRAEVARLSKWEANGSQIIRREVKRAQDAEAEVDRLQRALSTSCREARNETTEEYPMGACPEIGKVHVELAGVYGKLEEAQRQIVVLCRELAMRGCAENSGVCRDGLGCAANWAARSLAEAQKGKS